MRVLQGVNNFSSLKKWNVLTHRDKTVRCIPKCISVIFLGVVEREGGGGLWSRSVIPLYVGLWRFCPALWRHPRAKDKSSASPQKIRRATSSCRQLPTQPLLPSLDARSTPPYCHAPILSYQTYPHPLIRTAPSSLLFFYTKARQCFLSCIFMYKKWDSFLCKHNGPVSFFLYTPGARALSCPMKGTFLV